MQNRSRNLLGNGDSDEGEEHAQAPYSERGIAGGPRATERSPTYEREPSHGWAPNRNVLQSQLTRRASAPAAPYCGPVNRPLDQRLSLYLVALATEYRTVSQDTRDSAIARSRCSSFERGAGSRPESKDRLAASSAASRSGSGTSSCSQMVEWRLQATSARSLLPRTGSAWLTSSRRAVRLRAKTASSSGSFKRWRLFLSKRAIREPSFKSEAIFSSTSSRGHRRKSSLSSSSIKSSGAPSKSV